MPERKTGGGTHAPRRDLLGAAAGTIAVARLGAATPARAQLAVVLLRYTGCQATTGASSRSPSAPRPAYNNSNGGS